MSDLNCYHCCAGLACREHPVFDQPSTHSPAQAPSEPPAAGNLPRSFQFYQPSQPITISKPWNELSDSERAHIIATNPAHETTSGNTKRKLDNASPNSAAPSNLKHPRNSIDTHPSTSGTTTPVHRQCRSAAYDAWKCVTGCSSETAPENIELGSIIDGDVIYQRSKPFELFRRPLDPRLRCIYCLRDSGIWRTWLNREGGVTGRIHEHMQKYHSEEFLPRISRGTAPPTSDSNKPDLEYSSRSFSECLAQWIAVDDQAMNVVESTEFRQLLILASRAPKLQDNDIPHRTKVGKTIGELYAEEKKRIKRELKHACGRVSITSDLWSDNNLRAFMAVTVHYINSEGYLAEHLIAFRRIKGHHTGVNVGQVLFSILDEFGIVEKLGHITLDNASPNDTMMTELERVFKERGLITFGRTLNRIRCFPHVINLAVTTILKELPSAVQWFRDEMATEGYTFDQDVEEYLIALESGLVGACRESIKAMRSSDICRDGFSESIKHGNFHGLFKDEAGETLVLPVLQLLRDSETRWSSTYNMIKRYLELYPAILQYSVSHPEMKLPIISRQQCTVLQDLVSVLSILHSAQELLSAERTPTLALALPVYENLIQALRNCKLEFPMLQYAIECGARKLDAYVAKTRDTPAYALAMAINPCLKFQWIDQHWSRTQRNEARVQLKERMLEVRQHQHKTGSAATVHLQTDAECATRAQHNGYMRVLTLSTNLRRASSLGITSTHHASAPGPSAPSQPTQSPLLSSTSLPINEDDLLVRHMADVDSELLRWEAFDKYDTNVMGTVNLVDFWKAQRYAFPLLYQVAMDILPVQASSVSSERAFSSSKMTCTRERSKISAENMEHLQVLKHGLHRRRADGENHQTLDFMAHIVSPDTSEDGEDGDN